VREFLITNGVSPDRITARGHGEIYPIASNSSAAGRQQNRRVDVVVMR
jgi:OmpA-OmpF porin, OOP family